ncbi:MAG: GGDEF domain-containing protein [Rhodoferax sp.]|nr:GGDEF domain-containing protein [Rhodoferax sp.]MBK9238082.1 GGDEF domain-containing protein [Rhodoferax sp.]
MSTATASSLVDPHALRLDDARALLEHGGDSATLPKLHDSPTAYLQAVIDALCELSLKDPLTGLANRRHFRAVLERAIDVVARSGESALLLMLDIDHFKKINDTHGHLAGDQVLQAMAKCLSGCVRPMDTVARYGGEEFAVVMPNCQVSYGETVAERIRRAVEELVIAVTPSVTVRITVSIGGAYAPEWVRSTSNLWTERADVQLYRAKTEGRNRVFIDQQPVVAVSAEEKNLLFGHLALGEPAWIESLPSDISVAPQGAATDKFQ